MPLPPKPRPGSAAPEILSYSVLRVFAKDGTIDADELRMIEKMALEDGIVDGRERAVLSRIFDRVDRAALDPEVRAEIDRFRQEHGVP